MLNATMELSSPNAFDGSLVIVSIARAIQEHLISHGVEIAHLKVTLSPQEGADAGAVTVLNLVQNDGIPEVVQAPAHEQRNGQLTLNLRAEADPKLLHESVNLALNQLHDHAELTTTLNHLEAFRPARPQPTHRLERA